MSEKNPISFRRILSVKNIIRIAAAISATIKLKWNSFQLMAWMIQLPKQTKFRSNKYSFFTSPLNSAWWKNYIALKLCKEVNIF